VTLFVGAGISVPSGAPDFRRLRDFFLTPIIGNRAENIDMTHLSPEQIFDALDDGRRRFRSDVRAAMWWECEAREPNANHYAVAALGAAGARVWTPNFDTLIERAAQRLGVQWYVVTPESSRSDTPAAVPPGALVLFKPHGSFPFTGDPPQEPPAHDYPLLFRASDVWTELSGQWRERLVSDISGRDLHLFGYRGADLDIVPVLARAIPHARTVEWWERAEEPESVSRLRVLFADAARFRVRVGDPSAALQQLASPVLPAQLPRSRQLPRQPSRMRVHYTNTTRASVVGQFRGAGAARYYYARALLLDPRPLRRSAAWHLLRSAGFDIRVVGAAIIVALRSLTRISRFTRSRRTWELFAALVDAQPLRPCDRRDLRRLENAPESDRAEIQIRLASKRKRTGELAAARAHAERALSDIYRSTEARPRLEAMTVYNLAWILRQQWDVRERSQLVERYRDRLAHIGFNWAAWLRLDDALMALSLGDIAGAEGALSDPFLRYATDLIGHPMYTTDDQLARTLLRWCARGPAGVESELAAVYRSERSGRWPPYRATNTLLLLADHARATGDAARMDGYLAQALRSLSSLQRTQGELVAAVAREDERALSGLRKNAEDARFGLILATLDAVHRTPEHGRAIVPPVVWEPRAPLPCLF